MEIKKVKDKIVIEIPFWSKRHNPYMPGEDVGEYKSLVGIVDRDEFGNEELGFAYNIDMDYKDKADQNTDIVIHYWNGTRESFIELCKKLELDVIEYPVCAYCRKAIYGSFTIGDKGNQCFNCEQEGEKHD